MDVENDESEGSGEGFYRYVREELLKEIGPGDTILLVYPNGTVQLKVKKIYHKGRYIKCRVVAKEKELSERRVEFEDFIKYGTIL